MNAPLRWLVPALLLTASSVSAARKIEPEPSFEGARAETYKTVGDVSLKIYIFEPEGHKPSDQTPAIVCFFGGGWTKGDPSQFEHQCRYLASRGMVAMAADYRVSSRHGTQVKECVQDAKSAVRWARTNAARLGIDPQRIVAAGGSAGGHLAACTGILTGWDEPGEPTTVSSVPNAMVLFNPAGLYTRDDGSSADGDKVEKGKTEEGKKSRAERMGTAPINLSPANHVRPGIVPTIMFYGTEDGLSEGGKVLQQKMHEAGNRCELKWYEGFAHGFFNYGRNDNVPFAQTLAEADRFLVSLGYLKGEPQVETWMQAQP